MNEFVASNGVAVREVTPVTDRGPWLLIDGEQVSPNNAQALRQFFQAEADERLGRWRWPDNPDYVVYPTANSDAVEVSNQSGGISGLLHRDGTQIDGTRVGTVFHDAARAYFDAHPEPKPWRQAEAGEIWELTVEGVTRTYASIASTGKNDVYVRFFPTHEVNAVTVGVEAPVISAGRRIYPEVSA